MNSLRAKIAHLVFILSILTPAVYTRQAFSIVNCGTTTSAITVGPSGCDVQFGLSRQSILRANQPSVALSNTGLVVEAHKTSNALSSSSDLYLRVGKLNGMSVTWGPDQPQQGGYWPTVALTKDGYLIFVKSSQQTKVGSSLTYRVGKLDLNGDQQQQIQWLTGWEGYDAGFHTSICVEDNGYIVGVHETAQTNDKNNMYYRVGHLGGDFKIFWDSGGIGRQYDRGINPHIATNGTGELVEVHQVGDAQQDHLLHYNRAHIIPDPKNSAGRILSFDGSQRYDSDAGLRPAVAITPNGIVIELHSRGNYLWSRTGKLGTKGIINFNNPVELELGTYAAVATNGSYAIQTHELDTGAYYQNLHSSTTTIWDRSNWMGDMLPSIGSQTLGGIVIPGSHDAGMYEPTSFLADQALTQDRMIYQQLQAGARYFDLRVKSGDPQRIHHGGFTGPTVTTVLRDVKNFMLEGHKEVVVLKFSHFNNFGENDYNVLQDTIATYLGPWLYQDDNHPARVPLNDILRQGGRVIVVVDGDWAQRRQDPGFFVYKDWCSGSDPCDSTGNPQQGQFNVYDQYSNTLDYNFLKSNQFEKLANYNGKMKTDPSVLCDLFLLSWTLTPITGVEIASIPANENLGDAMNSVVKNKDGFFPNILYVDYFERSRATDTAIVMTRRFLDQ